MKALAEKYLSSKKYAWAPSTLTSERSRLIPLTPLIDGVPERLWEALRTRSPYSRTTAWTRVVAFYDWAMEEGASVSSSNPYKKWRKENARLFKNTYTRRTPSTTYSEARELLQSIPSEEVRRASLVILRNGLRARELARIEGETVVGKGNKQRRIYGGDSKEPISRVSYSKIYRSLRKIGLKPHDLRKIAATEFHRRGMSEVDLCHVMGWNSFATAKSYLAPKRDEDLAAMVQEG